MQKLALIVSVKQKQKNWLLFLFSFGFVALVLVPFVEVAAHPGDRPELAILPSELPDSNATIFSQKYQAGTERIKISRREFATFLIVSSNLLSSDRQSKIDPLQPVASSRLNLIGLISSIFAGDLPNLARELSSNPSAVVNQSIVHWAKRQLELLARLRQFSEQSPSVAGQSAVSQAARNYLAVRDRAQVLVQLVGLSPGAAALSDQIEPTPMAPPQMEPTVAGLRNFSEQLGNSSRGRLDWNLVWSASNNSQLKNTASGRWDNYRRDLIRRSQFQRYTESVSSFPQSNPNLILASVGNYNLLAADYQAIFGRPENDVYWNSTKTSRVGQIVLDQLVSAEAVQLGVIPAEVEQEIALKQLLYSAASQIVARFSPPSSGVELDLSSDSVKLELAASFIAATDNKDSSQRIEFDQNFLDKISWLVITQDTTALPSYLSENF